MRRHGQIKLAVHAGHNSQRRVLGRAARPVRTGDEAGSEFDKPRDVLEQRRFALRRLGRKQFERKAEFSRPIRGRQIHDDQPVPAEDLRTTLAYQEHRRRDDVRPSKGAITFNWAKIGTCPHRIHWRDLRGCSSGDSALGRADGGCRHCTLTLPARQNYGVALGARSRAGIYSAVPDERRNFKQWVKQ